MTKGGVDTRGRYRDIRSVMTGYGKLYTTEGVGETEVRGSNQREAVRLEGGRRIRCMS